MNLEYTVVKPTINGKSFKSLTYDVASFLASEFQPSMWILSKSLISDFAPFMTLQDSKTIHILHLLQTNLYCNDPKQSFLFQSVNICNQQYTLLNFLFLVSYWKIFWHFFVPKSHQFFYLQFCMLMLILTVDYVKNKQWAKVAI